MKKEGFVYIITNKNHTTLYTGVTSDLLRRISDHKNRTYLKSFSARYNLEKLVYYEGFHSIVEAIEREKAIKGGSRKAKEKLINELNPDWKDLYTEVENW